MANCYTLSILYTIDFKDFILWNPSLADTSTTEEDRNETDAASITDTVAYTHDFTNSCTISSNRLYCVGLSSAATYEATSAKTGIATPTPRAAREIANCTMWFDHYYEARCEDLMLTYDLYFDEFYEMNPSVEADCSGLVLGMNYCRSTYPGGREVGIPGWHSDDDDDDEIDPETYQEL
ncbi:peptidoglycan-binding lysin domain [Fusarium flagelliforme]|uniref:Peptidoglycan-binding lysin domain n=1 Tax=Fusarium flagelliforme TaxID=2675880 RepID=A0A395MLR8_9HYPO|nr:peptidoglycan-binding lysin domain [Fusarium flagelliforme]